MANAYGNPLLVRTDNSSTVLERVPLAGDLSQYSEAWLRDLLYGHPSALPIDEIDASFRGAVPVCRELKTAAGSLDILYITRDGRPAIVETKLWRNPEARRKVIGQVLDYASALTSWDFDQLDAAVRVSRRREEDGPAKGLLALFGLAHDREEAARFRDNLSRALRRGDMLLLVVGDGIREGAGSIAAFLDRYGSLHFTLGLVEMAIYRMADGSHLLQPRVLAQSEIARRIVVELVDGAMRLRSSEPEPEEERPEVAEEIAKRRKRFGAFWDTFVGSLVIRDPSQPPPVPARAENQYFAMPEGSQAWVSAYLMQSKNQAGVYLTFSKGPTGDRLYAALREDKDAIEHELNMPVKWQSDGTKHSIMSVQSFGAGSLIEDHGEAVRTMMAERVNGFISTFRPRLSRLVREGV